MIAQPHNPAGARSWPGRHKPGVGGIERRAFARHHAAWLVQPLLLILAAALFLPIVPTYFLADDFSWVFNNYAFDWSNATQLLVGDWPRFMAHEFRPLWALTFRLDLSLWGIDPRALHLTNIALHVLTSALVYFVASRASNGSIAAATLALGFFIVAPVHEGAVAWIAARGHVLVTMFILATLLLFTEFRRTGRLSYYVASMVSAIGSFMSLELCVALPPLLLLHELVYPSPSVHRSTLKRLLVHAPVWIFLIAYFAVRLMFFGSIQRTGDEIPSLERIVFTLWRGVQGLWLSPTMMVEGLPWLTVTCVALLMVVLISPLILARGHELDRYLRGVVYFGICWPLITLLPLLGAYGQRHLYLASVGPAILTGMAAGQLISGSRRRALVASSAPLVLLAIYGWLLVTGVQDFAHNGELSYQLLGEIEAANPQIATNDQSVLVVIPEIPDKRRVFWAYALRFVVRPPFMAQDVSSDVLPSLDAYGDDLDEWLVRFQPVLTRIANGEITTVQVIEWDMSAGSFRRRVMIPVDFLAQGYLSPAGPLMREGVRH
jgi:hypothetical protein